MQNSKRRRGISLCHKSNPSPNPNQNLDNSVYTNTNTTRIQYPRYQIPSSPSRHASAPKAKVNFAYPINHHPPQPQPHPQQLHSQQPISIQKILIPITHPHLHQEPTDDKPKIVTTPEIPERYVTFEQCKETIGKKLFGGELGNRREKVLQESDRSNRWVTQEKVQNVSETSIVESMRTYKQRDEKSWKYDDSENESYYRTTEKPVQIHQVKPQTQSKEPTITVLQPQSNPKQQQNIQCRRKRQLQIQKQVVNYFAEVKSKVQAPPTPQKQVKKPRDPAKLQQMQRRLLQIIKICDENIS